MLSAFKIFQWALDFSRLALRKWQRMLEVRFGSPQDLSTAPFLTWWHIPVMGEVRRGWRGLVESADLKHGRVILIFEGPVLRNVLPLLWQSLGRAERVRNNTSRGRTEDSSGCCQEWKGLSASLPVTCRGSSSYGSKYAYSLKGRYRFGAGFLQDAWF